MIEITRDELRNLLDAPDADARLEAMHTQLAAPSVEDRRSAERVMGKLNGPLPRQKQPFWRVPAALLDWQFSPAWPRVAALAGCALIGFSVGIVGVDRSFADNHGWRTVRRWTPLPGPSLAASPLQSPPWLRWLL